LRMSRYKIAFYRPNVIFLILSFNI